VIYFIHNQATGAIKIGYSKNAKKRLASLQTATPHQLVLLGTVQGGLEHEAALHERFAQYALQGEWFKGDIIREVMELIAREASNPQQQKTNVIVSGDSDSLFAWSSDSKKMAEQTRLETAVHGALDEIQAKMPIAWVITGGERQVDHFAWRWADKNKVQVYRYYPKWRRYGRYAAFKVGPQMLRSMFDPKLLLVFVTDKVSSNTQTLIRRAEKSRIQVVTKCYAVPEASPSST
jgi:hypothetical protein